MTKWGLNDKGQKLFEEKLKDNGWDALNASQLAVQLKVDRSTASSFMNKSQQGHKSKLEIVMTQLGLNREEVESKTFANDYFIKIEGEPISLAIAEAYRKCCPEGFDRTVPQGDEKILERLKDMQTKDGVEALSRFACLLSLDKRIPSEIKTKWAPHIKPGDREKLLTKDRDRSSSKCSECYRLMVYIAPSRDIKGRSFSIEYSLLIDSQPDGIGQELEAIPFSFNLRSSYESTEIQDVVKDLLDISGEQVPLSDTILELFLPNSLLGINLSSITLENYGLCQMFIRFQERQERHFKKNYGDWKKSWKLLTEKIRERTLFRQVYIPWNDCMGEFRSKLHQFEYASCYFAGDLNEFSEIVQDICKSPLSTAVWSHQGRENTAIETFVLELCISELSRSLARLRQEVCVNYSREPDRMREQYAHYIHLLWDNPHRMFPANAFTSEST